MVTDVNLPHCRLKLIEGTSLPTSEKGSQENTVIEISSTTSEEGSNFFPTSEEGSDQENQTNVKDRKMSLPTSPEGSQENQTDEQHKDCKRGSVAARIVGRGNVAARIVRRIEIFFCKDCHGTDSVAVIKRS